MSSDRDASQFDEYYAEMPWLALPFADREAKSKLSKKFKVEGIPTLVVLDAEGNTLTTKGTEKVSADPTGFPWPPTTFEEDLGTSFVGKTGTVQKSEMAGKYVGEEDINTKI